MAVKSYYPQERLGILHREGYGFIHVCFGQGVGKTSRCIGLAVRAAGAGLFVTWVQFMKSDDSSEAEVLGRTLKIDYRCPGKHPFIFSAGPKPVHYEHAKSALRMAKGAVKKGTTVLICDEILNTVVFGVLDKSQLLDLMDTCRGKTELVMSGTDAAPEIIASADYVTEFVQRKHPYYSGHLARQGIEY